MTRPFVATVEQTGGMVENGSGGVTAHGHEAMLAMFASKVHASPASDAAPHE